MEFHALLVSARPYRKKRQQGEAREATEYHESHPFYVSRIVAGADASGKRNSEKAKNVMEIKWHDIDPATEQKRYLCAERFAGVWRFRWKLKRRGEWTRGLEPTRAMWEHVLDSLKRRYRRREGVSDEDIEQVERVLAEVKQREEIQ
jgi:hypothetical protein